MGRPIDALLGVALLAVGCGGSPTAPERSGPITVTIQCEPAGGQRTTCHATVDCGLYGCPAGTPHDITATSAWTVENASVARAVAPGELESVAPGDTVVKASNASLGEGVWPISVFAGSAPLPTFILTGTVTDGSSPAHPPLEGVTIEILDGLVSGRTATSGVAPPFMPGYWTSTVFASGEYEFFGVPKATYRLRASKAGYVAQEREAGVGVNAVQFVLERAE